MRPQLRGFITSLAFVLLPAMVGLAQRPELVIQQGHLDTVNVVVFSSDGRLLASGSRDGTVKIFDAATGIELRTLMAHAGGVASLSFRLSSNDLASSGFDRTIKIWDAESGTLKRKLERTTEGYLSSVHAIAYSPDGKTLVAVESVGEPSITFFDAATFAEQRRIPTKLGDVQALVFSPDGKTIAVAGYEHIIKLFDAATGAEQRQFKGHTEKINALAFSADGRTLASASEDGTVKLWSVDTGQPGITYAAKSGEVNAVLFFPDGKRVVSGGDGGIKIWDAQSGTTITSVKNGRTSIVRSLALSSDSRTLASGTSIDDAVTLRDAATGSTLADLPGRVRELSTLVFAPDGKKLFVGRAESPPGAWDLTTGKFALLSEEQDGFSPFSLSPDGSTIAARRETDDGMALTLFDAVTGKEKLKLPPRLWSRAFGFSPDGRLIAGAMRVGQGDKATYPINLWHSQTGALVRQLKGFPTDAPQGLAFSPDGRTIAAFERLTVKLWDVQTGVETRTLAGQKYHVTSVAFSPDSKVLAVGGGMEKSIKLWDLSSGTEARTLAGHELPVLDVAFSPDGKLLASGAGGASILRQDDRAELKIWDVITGRELRSLTGHHYDVRTVVFSPDGKLIATAGGDGTIRLWDVNIGRELATLRVLNDSDWIVTTPTGHVDAANEARAFLSWRYSPVLRDVIPFQAFAADFQIDGLLTTVVNNTRPPTLRELSQQEIAERVRKFRDGQSVAATRVAEQAVQQARENTPTNERPRVFVQTGHVQPLVAIAVSPDGSLIASASEDNTVKLWDAQSGRELRSYKGFAGSLSSSSPNRLVFSRDGKILAGGSKNAVTLWNVETGAVLHHFKHNSAPVFNREGTLLVTKEGYKIIFRNSLTGEPVREIDLDWEKEGGQTSDLSLSPDGMVLASLNEKGITLRNAETGAIDRIIGKGAVRGRIAFSTDGQTIASLHDNTLTLWDLKTGRANGSFSPQRVKAEYSEQFYDNNAYSFALSPDGQTLVLGTLHGIELWKIKTNQLIRTLPEQSFAQRFDAVTFSPDGQRIVAGALSGIYVWDAGNGRQLARLDQQTARLLSIAFGDNGKLLAIGSIGSTKIWDLTAGYVAYAYKDSAFKINFTPDGKSLVRDAERIDFTTGKIENLSAQTYASDKNLMRNWRTDGVVALSNDGKLLAGIADVDYSSAQASNSKSGRIRMVRVDLPGEVRVFGADSIGAESLAFSPDGKLLASAHTGGAVKIWEVANGRLLKTLTGLVGPSASNLSIRFSPKGDFLAASAYEQITLWDIRTWVELRTIKTNESVAEIVFSPDGGSLLAGLWDGSIKIWNASTGAEVRTLEGHADRIRELTFTAEGNVLTSVSIDDTIKLWDAKTGAEIATLVAVGRNDWLVVTPDGLFDGTSASFGQIQWRFSSRLTDVAPMEWFFNDYFRPGLLSQLFGAQRPRAKQAIAGLDRRQPRLSFEITGDVGSKRTARELPIKINVTDAGAGAQDVRLFRNGSLVKVWPGDVLKGQSTITLETTIPIVVDENKLTAYAFNHDNIKSRDATLTVTGADSLKRQGTLHLLAIGVGRYANRNYNLDYTPDDATSFAAQLKLEQEKLQQYKSVEVSTLLNENATKQNVLAELKKLSTIVQPEDAVVVYFSGHGKADGDHFYLIPHDLGYTGPRDQLPAAGLRQILANSISDMELEEAFRGIDAGLIFMIIDACNSGQALENKDEPRRGPMNTRGLAQLAYEKGMYIMAASQNVEEAFVSTKLKHSYLTFALVEEGLKTKLADENGDGKVTLREWFDYAALRVPKLREETLQSKSLEEVTSTVKAARAQKTQTPRPFYRHELEAQPFIVAKITPTK